jgi:hypothetical protein
MEMKDKIAFLIGFAFAVVVVLFWMKERRDREEMERQLAAWQAEEEWTYQLLEARALEGREVLK